MATYKASEFDKYTADNLPNERQLARLLSRLRKVLASLVKAAEILTRETMPVKVRLKVHLAESTLRVAGKGGKPVFMPRG